MLIASLTSGLTHFHGVAAYCLVAGLVIAESGFVIGFFVPGEIAVVIGGVLAKLHQVNLFAMLAVSISAAIAAFLIGYLVGQAVGPWLLQHRPLKGQPAVARTEKLIQRFGGPAVFVGRFVALVRAIMPALVGISDVNFRTFLIFDVVGGVIWATLYTLIGFAVGSAYTHVVSSIGKWSIVIVAVLALALLANHLRQSRRHKGVESA